MVVEFIVKEHGFDALKGILNDLKTGLTINDALDRRTGGLAELDSAFEKYITNVAEEFAKGVEFDVEREEGAPRPNLIQLAESTPNHYTAGLSLAASLIRSDDLERAEQKLKFLIELFPDDNSANSARRMLAEVYRRTDRVEEQRAVLAEHLQRSAGDL